MSLHFASQTLFTLAVFGSGYDSGVCIIKSNFSNGNDSAANNGFNEQIQSLCTCALVHFFAVVNNIVKWPNSSAGLSPSYFCSVYLSGSTRLMANGKCETVRLAFFFASPRHFDFLNCERETSRLLKSKLSMTLYKSLTNEPSVFRLAASFVEYRQFSLLKINLISRKLESYVIKILYQV